MTGRDAARMPLQHSHPARSLRRASLAWSDATGQLTAPLRMGPDFLIVGAQRCGTTSLFKTLMQHPDVAAPFLRKGIHYFDKSYERGLNWYRGHFPLSASSRLRRRGRQPITGESSPYYMFHPLAPARIAADLPEVRVLVLLRDPVERAYSAHAHELARGFETLPFEQALEAEPDRVRGERARMLAEPGYASDHWQHHAYVTRGEYVDQLLTLEAALGRQRVLVLDSGDFFAEPAPVFAQVAEFLGLASSDRIVFAQHNARTRSPLPVVVRRRLEQHFLPYDERLTTWWGTPSWRRA